MKICAESSSLGCKGLVGICDPEIFAYRVSYSDLGVVSGDFSCGVFSTRGERANSTRIPIAQVDDRLSGKSYQDVHIESYSLPRVFHFRAIINVTILEYVLDEDSIVCSE